MDMEEFARLCYIEFEKLKIELQNGLPMQGEPNRRTARRSIIEYHERL